MIFTIIYFRSKTRGTAHGVGLKNLNELFFKNNYYLGENGYARMIRNKGNQCGIANEVAYILPPDAPQRISNTSKKSVRQGNSQRNDNLKFNG